MTTDTIRNESVLFRPLTSAAMNKSNSDISSLALCNKLCDGKTSSIIAVQASGMQYVKEYTGNISDQRSYSSNQRLLMRWTTQNNVFLQEY